jgi:hypothetical protein
MVAGVGCRIGDDSRICRIFPKEERCDSDEVISIEGRNCMAQAQPASSAGRLLETAYQLIRPIPRDASHRQFDPGTETAYLAIAISDMQSDQICASGKNAHASGRRIFV